MAGKEVIVLDAEVLSVVGDGAFEARLANGHRFTAYVPAKKRGPESRRIRPGSRVRVRFSPFSMAQAEILLDEAGGEE